MQNASRSILGKLGAGAALVFTLSAGGAFASGSCDPARAEFRGPGVKASFSVSIADDVAERAQGLMFVQNMPRMSGMLFVYEYEQPVSFWMKNTLIPLDMIFIDAAGQVIDVHADAKPHDLTAIPSAKPARFVLELNGGMAKKLRIGVGSQMRHASIEQSIAAWPCD